MKVDVRYQPAFALAFVELDADESIQVEAGAMVGMSPDLKLITEARGG
ncbi:MAG: AIM24 family protein, partial [Candidatus Promineifilaceae bacterium]